MESLIGDGFAELFDSTHESMLRIALGETRDRQLALDACQNAYLKLLRARREGPAVAEPRAWLARVVRNEARALRRARQTPAGPLVSIDTAPLRAAWTPRPTSATSWQRRRVLLWQACRPACGRPRGSASTRA